MIKNVLSTIGGVEQFGIISICLFFAFFNGAILWAFRQKRSHLDAMSALPLDPEGRLSPVDERHPAAVERSFPLSLGEREQPAPGVGSADTCFPDSTAGMDERRRTILPVPGGEGRGEGEQKGRPSHSQTRSQPVSEAEDRHE